MATPFSFSGTLNLPATPGLPLDPIPLLASLEYSKKAEFELEFTGSGTVPVPFGSIASPGAKFIVVMQESTTGAAAVTLRRNASATGGSEITPGGFVVECNPTPSAGITSLELVHTASGRVRVWLLA